MLWSRPRILTILTGSLAAATAATVVVIGAPTAVAAAEDLLTGGDIENGSITRHDVENGTLTGRDIRNGSIGAADLREGVLGGLQGGPQGPRGPEGPEGPEGPAGADGGQADGVATWTVHHDADGSTSVTIESTDQVPAHAVIEPLGATFTGNFSGCPGAMGVSAGTFQANGHGQFVIVNTAGVATNNSTGRVSFAGPAPLRFVFTCYDPNFNQLPVPTFDASLTFAWTVVDPTPTATFD